LETLAAHVELVLENNKRLQQIIADGELTYKSYPQYNGHPDLQDMKRELEREKDVLKSLFGDFEHHQADMNHRERELNAQYNALAQQMKEQYDLQSSTANIVEDYHRAIQELNHSLKEQQERYERELDHANGKTEEMEERIRALEAELDDAKDMLRNHHQEIESRDFMIADCQEKLKRTQRQLAQLRMDTLESRVGPTTKEYGDLGRQRSTHRRTTSRRSVSATSATSTNIFDSKPSEPPIREHPKLESLISFNSGGSRSPPYLNVTNWKDEMENKIPNKALSPKIANVEEAPAPRAPGQDAIARRAAAAKRLEERRVRNREQLGKENSYI
jgi:chromosome segregation ATPase